MIGVIGDVDVTQGFSLTGTKIRKEVRNKEEARKAWDSLRKEVKVLLLSEQVGEWLRKEISMHKDIYPVVIEVPQRKAIKRKDPIHRVIRRAVGVVPKELR